jgi:NAD(P)-dependent dehydrogenase (short-subunit alcohol dehydrogenase family)
MTHTALVTGANRVIGFEVCRFLGQAGMRVLLGARDPVKSEAAAAVLVREGLDVTAVGLDADDPANGAASVVWAALLPDDGPTGGFFRDGQPVAW